MKYRLASRAGVLDVDRWCDGIPPEKFDEWIAYDRIEPDGLNRICGILARGFAAVCRTWGGKHTPQHFDHLQPKEEQAKAMGPGQVAAVMRQRFSR